MQRGTLQDELEMRLRTTAYMSVDRVLRLFGQVCEAVLAMHSLTHTPLVHRWVNDRQRLVTVTRRDIKAANVLMSDDGATCVLMDLGSACAARVQVVDRKHAQQIHV